MSKDFTRENVTANDVTVNEFIQQFTEVLEMNEKLVSSNEYMLWLEQFMSSRTGFLDDDWLYKSEEISKEDYARVEQLSCFISGIRSYAARNFIRLESDDDYDSHVFIKFNEIGYEIGTFSGQGTVAYCHRVDISTDKNFIDFNDIMTNKVPENVAIITEKLDAMANIAKEILKLGAPANAITSKIKSVLAEYVEGDE